jgi:hypothetical protein
MHIAVNPKWCAIAFLNSELTGKVITISVQQLNNQSHFTAPTALHSALHRNTELTHKPNGLCPLLKIH